MKKKNYERKMLVTLAALMVLVGCWTALGASAEEPVVSEVALVAEAEALAAEQAAMEAEALAAAEQAAAEQAAKEAAEKAAAEQAAAEQAAKEAAEKAAAEQAAAEQAAKEAAEKAAAEQAAAEQAAKEAAEKAAAEETNETETVEAVEAKEETEEIEATENTEVTEETETTENTEVAEVIEETEVTEESEEAEKIEAEEELVDIEEYETPLAIGAFLYRYQKNADGSLALDENGNPIALLEEGQDVPKTWLRDENGALILDRNGNPVATQTVPANAMYVQTLRDRVNPERSIDIYVSFGGDAVVGSTASFSAVLNGYDGLVYSLQWQQSDDGSNWENLAAANNAQLDVVTSEENMYDFWRVQVTITDVLG